MVMVKEPMFGPEDRPREGRGEKHCGQREQHVVGPKAGVSLVCWSTGQTRLILDLGSKGKSGETGLEAGAGRGKQAAVRVWILF